MTLKTRTGFVIQPWHIGWDYDDKQRMAKTQFGGLRCVATYPDAEGHVYASIGRIDWDRPFNVLPPADVVMDGVHAGGLDAALVELAGFMLALLGGEPEGGLVPS